MNRQMLDMTTYEALQALSLSGADRQVVYSGTLCARSMGDMQRSAAYYRLNAREGGIYE